MWKDGNMHAQWPVHIFPYNTIYSRLYFPFTHSHHFQLCYLRFFWSTSLCSWIAACHSKDFTSAAFISSLKNPAHFINESVRPLSLCSCGLTCSQSATPHHKPVCYCALHKFWTARMSIDSHSPHSTSKPIIQERKQETVFTPILPHKGTDVYKARPGDDVSWAEQTQ